MKKYLVVLSLLALMVVPQGCATKNPTYNPALPPTASGGSNPEYIPNTSGVSNVVGTVKLVNSAAPTPYQGLINNAGDLVLGLTTIIAGLVAASQNKKAVAANAAATSATAAAKVLANNIPSTAVQSTIESAPTPEIAGIVAQHLQSSPS